MHILTMPDDPMNFWRHWIKFPAQVMRVVTQHDRMVIQCADGSIWRVKERSHGRFGKKRVAWDASIQRMFRKPKESFS